MKNIYKKMLLLFLASNLSFLSNGNGLNELLNNKNYTYFMTGSLAVFYGLNKYLSSKKHVKPPVKKLKNFDIASRDEVEKLFKNEKGQNGEKILSRIDSSSGSDNEFNYLFNLLSQKKINQLSFEKKGQTEYQKKMLDEENRVRLLTRTILTKNKNNIFNACNVSKLYNNFMKPLCLYSRSSTRVDISHKVMPDELAQLKKLLSNNFEELTQNENVIYNMEITRIVEEIMKIKNIDYKDEEKINNLYRALWKLSKNKSNFRKFLEDDKQDSTVIDSFIQLIGEDCHILGNKYDIKDNFVFAKDKKWSLMSYICSYFR